MSNLLLFITILCILNSILFFDNVLGLNVLLFTIPLLLFLFYTLKINKKIINKKGLLFMIPIIILSLNYLLFNNIFRILNIFVIPILYIFMYVYTIKPTYNLSELLEDFIKLSFGPLNCIEKLFNIVKIKLNSIFKLSDNTIKKLKSLLIVIPIIIVVLILLTSADMMFSNIFTNFFGIFKNISFENIIMRTIGIVLLFIYLGSVTNYLIFNYKETKDKKEQKTLKESYTIKLLLTLLNIIYIIFDFIQIRSLIFHQVSADINYAQYAREGFFQLMFISFINIVILLISKKTKETKYNKIMSIIMILLTFIIIISSFLRMYMYESTFGYTLLRLLVYVVLVTEIILLIPTVAYVLNSNIKIIKHYMTIIIFVYSILNFINIDYIIANNNINRYYKTKKIDIYYLQNESPDNISLLIKLYEKEEKNQKIKNLNYYFNNVYKNNKIDNFFEYNISKDKATKLIKEKKLNKR